MYSTCIFCKRPLGGNAVLEEFPVGRRLAFDSAKGRLWVVCRSCERWNLSPLEERWEAIEAAERTFSDLRMRVSTDNIGIARHPEGMELVRIGRPLRPEFAAWRYGDQFGRRRRRAILIGVGATAAVGTVAVAGFATGVITSGILSQSGSFVNLWVNGRTLVRLRGPDGEVLKLKRPDLQHARFVPGDPGEWALLVGKDKQRRFTGAEAEHAAGVIVARLNASGAKPAAVQDAVREIERVGGPDAYIASMVRDSGRRAESKQSKEGLGKLPPPTRLAIEMSLHEDHERRALEGELALLEEAWKGADEIAAIADDLLLPDRIRAKVEQLRGGRGE